MILPSSSQNTREHTFEYVGAEKQAVEKVVSAPCQVMGTNHTHTSSGYHLLCYPYSRKRYCILVFMQLPASFPGLGTRLFWLHHCIKPSEESPGSKDIRHIAGLVQKRVRSRLKACHTEAAQKLRNCTNCRNISYYLPQGLSSSFMLCTALPLLSDSVHITRLADPCHDSHSCSKMYSHVILVSSIQEVQSTPLNPLGYGPGSAVCTNAMFCHFPFHFENEFLTFEEGSPWWCQVSPMLLCSHRGKPGKSVMWAVSQLIICTCIVGL